MDKMPVNAKENLIFTIMMVFIMALVMTAYNVFLHNGLSLDSLMKAWTLFPLTYMVAFLIEKFIVGGIAFGLIKKFIKHEDPIIKKILVSALCFVPFMVITMSLFGAIFLNESGMPWYETWLKAMPMNFIVAYPLQVLFAGPIVRYLFRIVFPVGTIIDNRQH